MKVLQINSVCGIRSTGKICTDLDEVLRSRGHESRILYGREEAPKIYRDISRRVTTVNEVRLHAAMARILDNSGFGPKNSTKIIINEIEKYNPDIIHLHNLHGYYLNIELLFQYLKENKRKIVWTLHDCWAYTGHCSHFSAINCEKWKKGCYDCPQKRQYPASILIDNSKKNYQRKKSAFTGVSGMYLVTPSRWLAGITKQSFLGDYPVKVIPNGVDLKVFRPNFVSPYRNRIYDGKRILLGVATAWSNKKGYEDFVGLSKLLDDRYQIVLVGLTDKQLRLLPKEIIGIKATNSRKELASYYSNAYALVSLSKEETMGLTVVEALACGIPAVVYDATALPEIVTEKCGKIVGCGNYKNVKDILDELETISDRDCVERAKKYEKQKMYEKYISLYEEIIK